MQRIEEKIDALGEKLTTKISSIDATLAAQHVSLKDHIRRTEILEDDIAPIKKHVAMVHGALKLLGTIAVAATAIEAIIALIHYIGH